MKKNECPKCGEELEYHEEIENISECHGIKVESYPAHYFCDSCCYEVTEEGL